MTGVERQIDGSTTVTMTGVVTLTTVILTGVKSLTAVSMSGVNMRPDELLMMHINWKFRQIHAHPRQVLLSAELFKRKQSADPLLEPFKEEFQPLTEMIAAGEDLSSLLSRDVLYKPYELNPDFARLKDEKHLDLLLNERGIHHLHLPTLERKKGTPIVFGIFYLREAFLRVFRPSL